MAMTFDAVVVSAFGRGHWLAMECRRANMNVLLLDMTSKLGSWPGEDGEGPFGVSRLDRFENSFNERLQDDDPIETVENGWTFWLPEGPLEFKGPLTLYHSQKKSIPARWLESFAKSEKVPRSDWDKKPFHEIWPLALSQQLASTRYRASAKAMEGGRPLPLTANFGVRFASRQGLGRNLNWLKNAGVVTSDSSEILDLSLGARKEISGLELKGELSGLAKSSFFVWTLTGGETQFLSDKLAGHLYPGGIEAPAWCWVRYRVSAKNHSELDRLPLHTVVVSDIEAPWTHENILILQKTPSVGRLDAWIRIPAAQRFNKDYLNTHALRIVKVLSDRLPLSEPDIQALPQEASYTPQELGEPRAPVWEANPAAGRRKSGNLIFESPENRENYSLDCEFDHQKAARDKVLNWWKIKVLKEQKAQKEKAT